MPEHTIWVLVAILLAAGVLLIQLGVLGNAREMLAKIPVLGKLFQQQIEQKTIRDICDSWLAGGDKYSADFITRLELSNRASPFTKMKCCSSDLRDKVLAVQIACEKDPGSGDCNSGNLKIADIRECENACQAVLRIDDLCRQKMQGSDTKARACLEDSIEASELCGQVSIILKA